MNKIKIGRKFEREALKILKEKFDEVVWLSKSYHSSFDFKCVKNKKIFFGDAKVVNRSSKPQLLFSQKEADFVIAKIKGEVIFFSKDNFKGNVIIQKTKNVGITIDIKLWRKLAQIKIDKGLRNYNEVLKILLNKKGVK